MRAWMERQTGWFDVLWQPTPGAVATLRIPEPLGCGSPAVERGSGAPTYRSDSALAESWLSGFEHSRDWFALTPAARRLVRFAISSFLDLLHNEPGGSLVQLSPRRLRQLLLTEMPATVITTEGPAVMEALTAFLAWAADTGRICGGQPFAAEFRSLRPDAAASMDDPGKWSWVKQCACGAFPVRLDVEAAA
jgi:hypothetical protein